MNRQLHSGPGVFGPFFVENNSALENIVSIVSRSAGVVILFAAIAAIGAQILL